MFKTLKKFLHSSYEKTLQVTLLVVLQSILITCQDISVDPRLLFPMRQSTNLEIRQRLQKTYLQLFDWSNPLSELYSKDDSARFEGAYTSLLDEVGRLSPRTDFFHGMHHGHGKAVDVLSNIILAQSNAEEAIRVAAFLREREEVHPEAWARAMFTASMQGDQLQSLQLPPMVEVLPCTFIPENILNRLEEERLEGDARTKKVCEPIRGDYSEDDVNSWSWYYREDPSMNSHHLSWHLMYPIKNAEPGDRVGELFYYMHRELLARYQVNRISNGLHLETAFYGAPDEKLFYDYDPKLIDTTSGRRWPARVGKIGAYLSNVNQPDADLDIPVEHRYQQLTTLWKDIESDNLIYAENKALSGELSRPSLKDSRNGIDLVGKTVEARPNASVNPQRYCEGGIHNYGHLLIGYSMDPLGEQELPPGIIAESATAMRDPMFYALHVGIEKIFAFTKEHHLPPYEHFGDKDGWSLVLPYIFLEHMKVLTKGMEPNFLQTFWDWDKYQVRANRSSPSPTQDVLPVCQLHLDNAEFEYEFTIESQWDVPALVTMRVFMYPLYDKDGRKLNIEEERSLLFVMDIFDLTVLPGSNTIRRSSLESSLTVPAMKHVDLEHPANTEQVPYCCCGMPQHLLLPKGRRKEDGGFQLGMFAILSLDDNPDSMDKVGTQNCKTPFIVCGLPNQAYPDERPMGWPFDRFIFDNGFSPQEYFISNYAASIPNAISTSVIIYHNETIPEIDE